MMEKVENTGMPLHALTDRRPTSQREERNRYYCGPRSDHFDGVRFFNPGQPDTDRSFGQILQWKLREKAARWPKSVQIVPVKPDQRVDGLRVTMVGHMTALIQIDGLNILTDPVWSQRASPSQIIGPKRVTAPGVSFEDLPNIDAVLTSHNHYDHLDSGSVRRLVAAHNPLFITPLGNEAIIRSIAPDSNIVEGDWNDHFALSQTVNVAITQCNHWSARTVGDRRMALWSGFFIRANAGAVWFAGDTGYGDGTVFRSIGDRYGSPDIALIPIGSYEPRWFMAAQHVNPAEAVQIMRDVEAKLTLGVHWGTFQLTDEAFDAPLHALSEALADAGIDAGRFPAARPGDVFEV